MITLEDMIATKREAEARIRWKHHCEWSHFYKCLDCGAAFDLIYEPSLCKLCRGELVRTGYAPPPHHKDCEPDGLGWWCAPDCIYSPRSRSPR